MINGNGIMTLITYLMYNLHTRKCSETKPRDHLHDVTNQRFFVKAYLQSTSQLHTICEEVEEMERTEILRLSLVLYLHSVRLDQ